MGVCRYVVGDTRDVTANIPTGSIDLVVTSPPFLALRSYLPDGHPDKNREIGSEAGPVDFLATLLDLTVEWRRVLAPHGSLCVELGDTFSGSGGGGGDYMEGGMREGQPGFGGSAGNQRVGNAAHWRAKNASKGQWPLAKSMCGIPTLYTWSLAYGRNLLRPEQTFEPWRIRNVLVWARANPPVGALGDKFRPATSYITVACTSGQRWFDLDSVRDKTKPTNPEPRAGKKQISDVSRNTNTEGTGDNQAGAPPLDWYSEVDDGPNGDRLWMMNTAAYSAAHYATFPAELPARLIQAMCPRQVCTTCGTPRRRIVGKSEAYEAFRAKTLQRITDNDVTERDVAIRPTGFSNKGKAMNSEYETLGWSDCGHNDHWRNGVVLDPFAGSGTTGVAATGAGRDSILIDFDERNVALARDRVGMFLVETTANELRLPL